MQALHDTYETDIVQEHAEFFDFADADQGEVTIVDVQALFDQLEATDD